jgi:hypothetical protein
MPIYRIKNGHDLFETSETKKIKHLQWVKVPNKHDGKGYRRLVKEEDGLVIYAAWHLILQVASRCTPRWTLIDSDGPLTAEDLADKTGCPSQHFKRAFIVLTRKDIGWMEEIDEEGSAIESPGTSGDHPDMSGLNRIEGNRTEQNGSKTHSVRLCAEPDEPDSAQVAGEVTDLTQDPVVFQFPTVGKNKSPRWHLRKSRIDELQELFPAVNVMQAMREAVAWCEANPTKRKTQAGMARFVNSWLSRRQNEPHRYGGQANGAIGISGGNSPRPSEKQQRDIQNHELADEYERELLRRGGIDIPG